jgi:hypothetical protein
MDATVRVKDVLHILNTAGILGPPGPKEKYPPFGADIHSAVFPEMGRPDTSGTAGSRLSAMADLGDLRSGLFPMAASPTEDIATPLPMQRQTSVPESSISRMSPEVQPGGAHYLSEVPDVAKGQTNQRANSISMTTMPELPSTTAAKSRVSPRTSALAADAGEGAQSPEAEQAVVEASDSEVLACNFSLSIAEVLQLICEVSSPDSTQKLCWAEKGEDSKKEERIAILDFVETELAFCEFQRLLLRISECKTRALDPEVAFRLPIHRRLQGFLRHVLLPGLEPKRASKTESQPQEAAEEGEPPAEENLAATEATSAEEAAADLAPEVEAGSVGKISLPPSRAVSKTDQPQSFNLWQGFDDGDLHGLEELAMPRSWPEDYELSVGAW